MKLTFIPSILPLLVLLLITNHAIAVDNEVLFADQTIVGSELIEFPNDSKVYANKSDFEILHSLLMSNEIGERWATITVVNHAGGRRELNQDHILALMANGSRRFPLRFSRDFKSQQTLSVLIRFGSNQFPILRISTRQ